MNVRRSIAGSIVLLSSATLAAMAPQTALASPYPNHSQTDPTVCVAKVENPHRSGGAGDGRVVAKTRVTCNKTATVEIVSVLMWAETSGGKPIAVASSTETRTVQAGGVETFYVPIQKDSQVRAAGYYQAASKGQITAPVVSTIEGSNSAVVQIA
jgi:hypothetical protein